MKKRSKSQMMICASCKFPGMHLQKLLECGHHCLCNIDGKFIHSQLTREFSVPNQQQKQRDMEMEVDADESNRSSGTWRWRWMLMRATEAAGHGDGGGR